MVSSDDLLEVIAEVTNESFDANDVQNTISYSIIVLDGLFLAVRLSIALPDVGAPCVSVLQCSFQQGRSLPCCSTLCCLCIWLLSSST